MSKKELTGLIEVIESFWVRLEKEDDPFLDVVADHLWDAQRTLERFVSRLKEEK